jgi:hypothetical protein
MRGRLAPVCAWVSLAWLAAGPAAGSEQEHSHGEGKLVLFASAEGFILDGDSDTYDDEDGILTADVLGSWSLGRLRVLGELLLSTEEQEMERLQLGWQLAPDTFLWAGRFHQPASVWNSFHHHGQYLQPSITRPVIDDWEDEGGILPQHVEGFLFETRRPIGAGDGHGFMLAASAGIGPNLTEQGLEPYELFSSRSGDRHPAVGFRFMFLPTFVDDDGIGIVASHTEVGVHEGVGLPAADHLDLDVLGAYLVWTSGPWQTQATLYRVKAAYDEPATGSDEFWAGYLQARRELGSGLSALVRYDGSDGASRSRYVLLFDDFVAQRVVLDLRWDFAASQALSFEYANSLAREGRFNEFRLQWSAAFQ